MSDIFRAVLRGVILLAGLFTIYLVINAVVKTTNNTLQHVRDNSAAATIIASSVSAEPFGNRIIDVKPGQQIFYNISIQRQEGSPCYVQTSWRWVLHLPTGNSVMWNTDDGQFYAGDKSENLAQSVQVPKNLIPGDYTLSRLSVFKCGSVDDFARTVRNTNLTVK